MLEICVVSKLGGFPKHVHEVSDQFFCYLHVDHHYPIMDSLEFFYLHLVGGRILLCEYYGFLNFLGLVDAFEVFYCDQPESMIALRRDNLLMKGRAAAESDPHFELLEPSSSTY